MGLSMPLANAGAAAAAGPAAATVGPALQLDLTGSLAGALAHGAFPERRDRNEPLHDRLARSIVWRLQRRLQPPLARARAAATDADQQAAQVARLSDAALVQQLRRSAPALVQAGRAEALGGMLALVSEAAHRSLAVRPYPTQLMGAAVLLEGRLAEMATGEGKTLTAGLAAAVAGIAGLPTHVVTVNDYLARRDAGQMAPLMRFLGLAVGLPALDDTPARKAEAYACPVTYTTNQNLVFDYLRDRVAAGGRASLAQLRARELHGLQPQATMLHGLHYAIVDEADSILIDEARTPLILSQRTGQAQADEAYQRALDLARDLQAGDHYRHDAAHQALDLTPDGQAAIQARTAQWPGVWRSGRARDHLVGQALRALHLFHRDQHYVVLDGTVQIVDEYTGRVLEGRTWEGGLHQMIEAKEALALTEATRTLARITFQRFFCRYLRLAGMTGTAAEVAPELHAVYGLDVVPVPTHRPPRRHLPPARLMARQDAKWAAVAEQALALQQAGRPVLVGTRSVEASETLAALLAGQRSVHRLLNARQDAHEAEVIAQAGLAGTLTVATNMAGRGTDIHLGPGVAQAGGLVVMLTECHDSARIDRQLAGRCGRQGDPGEARTLVALDDAIFTAHAPALQGLLALLYAGQDELPRQWLPLLRWLAQRHAGRLHARTRRQTLRADRQLDHLLGFAGNQI